MMARCQSGNVNGRIEVLGSDQLPAAVSGSASAPRNLNKRLISSRSMDVRDVVILGAARTPIGRYGGTFKNMHPAELGAVAARAALARAGVPGEAVDEVIVGHGRQAGSGPNPARQVGHRAGLPVAAPAQTINKACASGLQAMPLGAQSLLLGESQVVLAGGIESMSRMPYLVDSRRRAVGPQDGALPVRRRDVSRRLPIRCRG